MQYEPIITFEEIVEEFVELCYDFHYLRHKKDEYHDPREDAVRKMFLACGNRNRIESALHDVHIGNYTLNELLRQRGFAQ